MSRVSHPIEAVAVTFDDSTLVANAGLIVPATLMWQLGLEALVNSTVRLIGRVGGAQPGRLHSRSFDFTAADVCAVNAVSMTGQSDRLRTNATGAVENIDCAGKCFVY